jgi:methionine synthase reductase
MSDKASSYAILWASQTGNAEWIAKAIHKEAQSRGFTGECFVMNEFELVSLCNSITPAKDCNR